MPRRLIPLFLNSLLSFTSNPSSNSRPSAPHMALFSPFPQTRHFLQASVVLHMLAPLPKMACELPFVLHYLLLKFPFSVKPLPFFYHLITQCMPLHKHISPYLLYTVSSLRSRTRSCFYLQLLGWHPANGGTNKKYDINIIRLDSQEYSSFFFWQRL